MVVEQLKRFDINTYFFSETGRRNQNEDVIAISEWDDSVLFTVADGVGGYNNGMEAANFASSVIRDFIKLAATLTKKSFEEIFFYTHQQLQVKIPGAATTIGGIYVNSKSIFIFWCGDVRVYFSNDENSFQSKDHTLLNLFSASKKFVPSEDINRFQNTITRSLGGNHDVFTPEVIEFSNSSKFRALICTDGVHSTINNDILLKFNSWINPNESVAEIRDFCSERASDNNTLLFIDSKQV